MFLPTDFRQPQNTTILYTFLSHLPIYNVCIVHRGTGVGSRSSDPPVCFRIFPFLMLIVGILKVGV